MFFPWRRYWPILVTVILAILLFVEVFSNRHFYYVLTAFSFDLETAMYRIALIEEAFGGGMRGHWFTGFGFVGIGPGNDNTKFPWENKDLTNMYIQILAQTGLMGLVPFLVINILYYRRLRQAANRVTSQSDEWLVWCLTAALVGWNLGILTVDAFAQIRTQLFMYIAICANMPAIIRVRAVAAQVAKLPRRALGRRMIPLQERTSYERR
jgi:hypothetical protein